MTCSITGSGGPYTPGQIVAGSEALSIHLLNDTTDVTTAIRSPGLSNYFTVWMTITDNGTHEVFTPQYGCWGYFVRSGLITDTYTVEIVENSARAVEIKLRCDNYELGTTINGVSTVAAYLRVRVEDGKQGVFLGWHSNPRIGPDPLSQYSDSENNNPEYGERELGTGAGSVVVWSSKDEDFVSRHPAWGAKPEWAAAEAILGPIGNHAAWCGIDDATYSTYGEPAFAPTQFDGFPNTQDSAPWYVADLTDDDSVAPVCRYIVMRKPVETGTWQFNPVHRGALVCHFNNEWVSPYHVDGVFPFQIFIGALYYEGDSSDGYINEPSDEIRAEEVRRVNRLEWPGEPPRVWLSDTAISQVRGNAPGRIRRKRRGWFY
jgi:hypothetical protein